MHTFNPLAHPILFDRPQRLTDIASWHAHIPFAFLCVELLAPDRFVELGTHSGDSYCAFCQAIDTLRLPTQAVAVDTWEGDAHTGAYGPEVLEELRAYHDPRYGRFSRLLQTTFDEALSHFGDASIDLLHIDGDHTYEAVRHDFEAWLPKLSARGVVLLHDTDVREADFGVWRLWEELERQYPGVALHDEHGIGALAVGPEVPDAFRDFMSAAAEDTALLNLLAALGAAVRLPRAERRLAGRETDVEMLVDAHRQLESQRDEAQAALLDAQRVAAAETGAAEERELERTRLYEEVARLETVVARMEDYVAQETAEQARLLDLLASAEADRARLAEEHAQLEQEQAQLAARLAQAEQGWLAAEDHLAKVLATKTWRYSRVARRLLLPARPAASGPALAAFGGPTPAAPAAAVGQLHPVLDSTAVAREKIRPLQLGIDPDAPRRINLLVPTISFDYFFAGYITKFSLARLLAERGHSVRIVVVDWCDFDESKWRPTLERFGLGDVADEVEVAYAFDRRAVLAASPEDRFVASTWWTAHIAHRAVTDLGHERFVYLIQEYEPATFAMGGFAALAEETYGFPHDAVFSTELLRDYFRRNRIGVYARGPARGDQHSVSFENAIVDVGEVTAAELDRRTPPKLLFYARPEPHAARNMFELGALALAEAAGEGVLDGWELTGIGTVGERSTLELGSGARLELLPRTTPDEYVSVLREHDVGLSLMYTPHPSLVPIEMASAGMLVVTNTYANKDADALHGISANFVPVEPTVAGIVGGIREAVDRVGDLEARAAGASVRWSRSWADSWDDSVVEALERFLAAERVTSASR